MRLDRRTTNASPPRGSICKVNNQRANSHRLIRQWPYYLKASVQRANNLNEENRMENDQKTLNREVKHQMQTVM